MPKDGKAVSIWENKNNAFLDVVQNIRKLITSPYVSKETLAITESLPVINSRNYRVQKDFDSIEKMEFVENIFQNIKIKILKENNIEFEYMLVNRNKIATESKLKISSSSENFNPSSFFSNRREINYMITKNGCPTEKGFSLSFDDYHLFWKEDSIHSRYPLYQPRIALPNIGIDICVHGT